MSFTPESEVDSSGDLSITVKLDEDITFVVANGCSVIGF